MQFIVDYNMPLQGYRWTIIAFESIQFPEIWKVTQFEQIAMLAPKFLTKKSCCLIDHK